LLFGFPFWFLFGGCFGFGLVFNVVVDGQIIKAKTKIKTKN
jgi:hypothetical protein